MTSFINSHREQYGVEPICDVLAIAASTYYEGKARETDCCLSRKSVKDFPDYF